MAFGVCEGKSDCSSSTLRDRIQESQLLPGLAISLVEEGLKRRFYEPARLTQTEDDGAITRWLLATLS